MRVSIIVPCRNEAAHVEEFLDALLRQRAPGLDLEVLVVDGMSNDGSREIVARYATRHSSIRILANPALVVSTGLNVALRAATGDIVLRMDVHTSYADDYVLQCVRVLERTGADNVGGPWVARGHGVVSEAIAAAFASPIVSGGGRAHAAAYEGPVDTVYLGCWRRDAFRRFGLFDEELVRNQDDEFNFRITRAGGVVWQSPAIRSWYMPRNSLRGLYRQYFQYGYWKVRVMQKHGRPAAWRHVAPAASLLTVVLLGVGSMFLSPARWLLGGLLLAYAVALALGTLGLARRNGWAKLAPVLPAVFATYHAAYGMGFLLGAWDFLVRRRGPRPSLTRLTREVEGGVRGA